MKYETMLERFLGYVKFKSRSDAASTTIPSTPEQKDFLRMLKGQLEELNLSDIELNEENWFLTATLPANTDKPYDKIGFISHVDTADFNVEGINPQVIENYDGEDIVLNKELNVVMSKAEFPNLSNYKGLTLITTDGTTLLGADDKAGITEIVEAIKYLSEHPEIEHGDIRIAFGPDEEIRRGADHFDAKGFATDYAFTMDGGVLGELEYESFNACRATVSIQGKNVHPGTAKDTMVSALELARKFQNALPEFEVPEHTTGREGFYHLVAAEGVVEEAKLVYILRDHSRELFNAKKDMMLRIAARMNKELDTDRITVDLHDEYYNMAEIIEKDFRCVDVAKQALENLDIVPIIKPIRGGTDGSKISFMGLPTPNIFAGGENMHGRYEYVAVESMEKATQVILEIARLAAL